MSITVNTNMSSIIAQRSLYKATNKMNTALKRLSTGLRINSSKDYAAGSAISTKLEYKMSSYNVAKDNAQMGQSMLDTANGTLSNINSMLQRMRDLSEQASNGTYGEDERKAMQAEIDGLTEEIYRIKNTTEFNGKKILGEEEKTDYIAPDVKMSNFDINNLTVEDWAKTEGKIIGISSAKELQNLAEIADNVDFDTKDRTFVLTSDIDLSGINWKPIGRLYTTTDFSSSFAGEFNGNNFTISNLTINNATETCQGLFGNCVEATIKNLNLDNVNISSSGPNHTGSLIGSARNNCIIENITASNVNINATGNYTGGLIGYINNSAIATNCAVISGTVTNLKGLYTGGFVGCSQSPGTTIDNCYSNCDVIGKNEVGGFIGVSCFNTTITNCTSLGTVKAINNSGQIGGFIGRTFGGDFVAIKNCTTYSEVKKDAGDTYKNTAGAFIGYYSDNINLSNNKYEENNNKLNLPALGGNLTVTDDQIKGESNIPLPKTPTMLEKFEQGYQNLTRTNLQVGINSDYNSVISVDTGFSLDNFKVSVLSENSARNSLGKIDAMMSKITDKLTNIGATQNRLESVMEFQEIQGNALTSANSLIKDADIAKESANYVKNQILQNVTSTLLSTANQNPSIALQLI